MYDAAPLSFAIESVGSVMSIIISRSPKSSAQKSHTFTTYQDNNNFIHNQAFESELPVPNDCHKVGNFKLTGIRKTRRSEPKITAMLDVVSDEVLSVSAEGEGAYKKGSITITSGKEQIPDNYTEQKEGKRKK